MTSLSGTPRDKHEAWRICVATARSQHGLVATSQLVDFGFSHKQIHGLQRSGVLERRSHGLYKMPGSDDSFEQAVMAACLRAGVDAVASHRTAARIWMVEGFEDDLVEITTARSNRMTDVIIHRTCDLGRGVRTVRAGIPVTNPTRTVVDLAGVVPITKLDVAVDTLLSRRMISLERLQAYLDAHGRGRRGVTRLRTLLSEYGMGTGDSGLETTLRRLIREARLPEPFYQYRVSDLAGYIGRLDVAWPDRLLGIEADSFKYHGRRTHWRRDLARRNRLTALGWRLIHLTKEDVTLNRANTIAYLQRELGVPPMFVA